MRKRRSSRFDKFETLSHRDSLEYLIFSLQTESDPVVTYLQKNELGQSSNASYGLSADPYMATQNEVLERRDPAQAREPLSVPMHGSWYRESPRSGCSSASTLTVSKNIFNQDIIPLLPAQLA